MTINLKLIKFDIYECVNEIVNINSFQMDFYGFTRYIRSEVQSKC